MNAQLVTANKVKTIILPSNGLDNSILGTELDEAIRQEICNRELSQDDEIEFNDLIYDNLDNKGFNNKLCWLYAETLANTLNYNFNTDIHFSSVDYISLNGQNVGDTIECKINIDCLPSIDDIAVLMDTTVDDVWQQLQILSNEQFSSYSGFISFYDTDLTALHNAIYANWDEGYIMLIIQLLLNETSNSNSDIELATIEAISSQYCGIIDMAYSFINDSNVIDELNDLLNY